MSYKGPASIVVDEVSEINRENKIEISNGFLKTWKRVRAFNKTLKWKSREKMYQLFFVLIQVEIFLFPFIWLILFVFLMISVKTPTKWSTHVFPLRSTRLSFSRSAIWKYLVMGRYLIKLPFPPSNFVHDKDVSQITSWTVMCGRTRGIGSLTRLLLYFSWLFSRS